MNHVIVTTKHRGVFFGELFANDAPTKVQLKNARMCVSWSNGMHGILGLAATGPNDGCRITDRVPEIELWDITAIIACSPGSVTRWEAAPWK